MDTRVSVQMIDYIANRYKIKGEKVNIMACLKLVFFAEKYHIMKYGKMISNDTFFAMPNGLVASECYNILKFDDINFEDDYRDNYLEEIKEDKYHFKSKHKLKNYDMLSDTDKEALNFALNNFGHLSEWELVDETHKYKEWKRYENLFNESKTKRENIILDDFFEVLEDTKDPYREIPKEVREITKDIFFGLM